MFGAGLIGGALLSELVRRQWSIAARTPFDWSDPARQAEELLEAESFVENRPEPAHGPTEIDFIWTAGRAGFTSDAATLAVEHASFLKVIASVERLKANAPDRRIRFHLLSSAGGLFEGQTSVNRDSKPKPVRPYGEAKLRQEYVVIGAKGLSGFAIYRPTSVYGYVKGGRPNLVSALISNAYSGRVSHIFGSPNTIRDFVWTKDIARYMAARIDEGAAGSRVEILASGKPTTLFEVVSLLRRSLHRPIYLRYDTAPSNALNNSFSKPVCPSAFHPTDLTVGIRQTIDDIYGD